MAKYCYTSGRVTNCTDNCVNCAKEAYRDLKEQTGKAELVPEEALRKYLGDKAFDMLKEFGHIEYCATLNGTRMYAV